MTLFQIETELRLLSGELRGHEDLDQWILLERLADEVGSEHKLILRRVNSLARRALGFGVLDELQGGWYA